jgi:hypothetical protein
MIGQQQKSSSKHEVTDDDDEIELELNYDCSSLTLEQSIKLVFNIIGTIKVPSTEKQQLSLLEAHI